MRAGAFAGATAFAFGFFVFPLFRPSNLAPILGFMLAPAGFLAGALVSLAWNLGRGASRPLVRIGVAALLPVVQWAYLMSPPGMVLRGAVLEANFLPAALQATLAPAGILQVWVVGLPPGEQQHYLRSMEHNLGGPTLGRHGYYAVRFVDTDALAGALGGGGSRRPDVIAVHGPDPPAVTDSRDLIRVTGHFAYRAMAPRTWIDPRGPHPALARAIALGDRDCRRLSAPGPSASGEDPDLAAFALGYARAALAHDAGTLAALTSSETLDPEPADGVPTSHPRPDVKIVDSRLCGAWGNRVLAFVHLVVNHESERWVGQSRFTIAARHELGAWRAIGASRAEASSASLQQSVETFDRSMSGAVRGLGELRAGQPRAQGRFSPATEASRRNGHLVWRPSDSPGIVAEVAEIACRLPEGGIVDHDRHFVLRPRVVGAAPSRHVPAADACPDGWPTVWRIWSVTPEGLAFSAPEPLPQP